MKQSNQELPPTQPNDREVLESLLNDFSKKLFCLMPHLRSAAVIFSWDFPEDQPQPDLPDSALLGHPTRHMHAGERIRLIHAASRFLEGCHRLLQVEVSSLAEALRELAKEPRRPSDPD